MRRTVTNKFFANCKLKYPSGHTIKLYTVVQFNSNGHKNPRSMPRRNKNDCTNQQPPQRGGAVPDPIWVGSKWLLAFPRVPVTPGTPLHFFAMLPPQRPQKGSTQHLQNWSPVFTFSFLLPFSCPSSSPHSSSSPDER